MKTNSLRTDCLEKDSGHFKQEYWSWVLRSQGLSAEMQGMGKLGGIMMGGKCSSHYLALGQQ